MFLKSIFLFLVMASLIVSGKKLRDEKPAKIQKVFVHRQVQPAPDFNVSPPKVLTKDQIAYDQCKLQCKKVRDQTNKEQYVQQLREQLVAAEALIAEKKSDGNVSDLTQHHDSLQKASRFDHLKAAAGELKHAVTGGDHL